MEEFLFIHAPKTAGGTIKRSFTRSSSSPESGHHVPAQEVRTKITEEVWSRTFTFGVRRNPFDRFVSFFHYENKNIKNRQVPKDRFKTWLFRQEGGRLLSCWEMFSDGEQIIVDYVLRFEYLKEDWARMAEEHDFCQTELYEKAVHKSVRNPCYQEYYDAESLEYVSTRHQKDLDYWGYSFE